MRRYDDPVDVRTGQVHGSTGVWEGPEQFLWRDRLWKVRDVVAHWVETGPWWQSAGVRAVTGTETADDGSEGGPVGLLTHDLVHERAVWRVEATRPRAGVDPDLGPGFGVFDLVRDETTGAWRLTGVVD